MTLISNPLQPCRLTLVCERLVLVLRYNAYPIALWVNLGWIKASDDVTTKSFPISSDYWLVLGRASSR